MAEVELQNLGTTMKLMVIEDRLSRLEITLTQLVDKIAKIANYCYREKMLTSNSICTHCKKPLNTEDYQAMLDKKVNAEEYICYNCWEYGTHIMTGV